MSCVNHGNITPYTSDYWCTVDIATNDLSMDAEIKKFFTNAISKHVITASSVLNMS
jgi:hypothetical protein